MRCPLSRLPVYDVIYFKTASIAKTSCRSVNIHDKAVPVETLVNQDSRVYILICILNFHIKVMN